MSDAAPQLKLYNTLTREKDVFAPLDRNNVRMYVCGPTVYDYAHIGNARPAIVFDVLYRLLRHLYGADRVTYVRNITDVDDKINDRALRDYGAEIAAGRLTLNEAIRKVTEPTYEQYQKDVTALGCLLPTHQPRATEHIDGMITMAQELLDRGHAYLARGGEGREVLFDVSSMPDYGRLSNRRLEDQQAGARIEVKDHKKNPGDFVLWKESSQDEPGWHGRFHVAGEHVEIFGRPGWHLECSVMSEAYLGREFDIHGGGLDLIFPHHENEIAQSRCAHGTDVMARVWMHNGFLQVEGRKMSKSEGNFVTIHELLETEKFGGRKWPGEVLRLAMLMTHYREPIDFSVARLEEAYQEWVSFGRIVRDHMGNPAVDNRLVEILSDDLSTSDAITHLRSLRTSAATNVEAGRRLTWSLRLLGFFEKAFPIRMQLTLPIPLTEMTIDNILLGNPTLSGDIYVSAIASHLRLNYPAESSYLVDQLLKLPDGLTIADVRRLFQSGGRLSDLLRRRDQRLAFIRDKNWEKADLIRDELLAQGIQLKDGKDPATGERVTTWEVKR